MFRRKFGYESSEAPSYDDLTREDDIDVEVSCSGYGFTKEMENELLEEYGIVEANDEDDDSDNEENIQQSESVEQPEESTNYTEAELDSFRREVEQEIENTTKKPKAKSEVANSNIQKYIDSVSQHVATIPVGPPLPDQDDDNFEDAFEAVPLVVPITLPTASSQSATIDSDAASVSSNDFNDLENDDLADLDPNSRQYRFKMVEKILSDARSMRSFSTSASTIAPSVIKDKIKKNMDLKEKKDIRKRCVAKGEASAVTRGRKENRNTCKEYAGWDF